MRIAVLGTTAVETEGSSELGPPRTIRGFSQALSTQPSSETTVLVIKWKPQPVRVSLSRSLKIVRCWAGDTARVIGQLRPDILQTFSTTSHTPQGLLAGRLARSFRGLWVETGLGLAVAEKSLGCAYTGLDVMWERAALGGADHLVFPSRLAASVAMSCYGSWIQPKSSVIPLGIEQGISSLNRPPNSRISPESAEYLRIVSVGAIAPHKGQDLLLDAFRRAKISGRLDIVGPTLNPRFHNELEKASANLRAGKEVRFLGYLPHVETLQAVAGCDLFCLFSRFDVFPQAVIEAMANHIAPVVTKTVGCADLIDDRKSGYIVNPEDPQSGAGALEEVASDRRAHAERGERAWIQAQKLAWPAIADRYGDLYRRLNGAAT